MDFKEKASGCNTVEQHSSEPPDFLDPLLWRQGLPGQPAGKMKVHAGETFISGRDAPPHSLQVLLTTCKSNRSSFQGNWKS